jgi:hypothetical protein
VRNPSAAVVIVQPSSVVVGGVVRAVAAVVVRGLGVVVLGRDEEVRDELGAGDGAVVTDGSGAGKLVSAAGNRSMLDRAPSRGVAVRSTGISATDASTMLVAVAAHQPAIGSHREDRTKPCSHLPLWWSAWR